MDELVAFTIGVIQRHRHWEESYEGEIFAIQAHWRCNISYATLILFTFQGRKRMIATVKKTLEFYSI